MGYKISFINSVLAIFSGYLINYTIPRSGDIARGTIVYKYENIPSDKAINLLEMQMISPSWSFVELFSNDLESKSIRLNLLSCLATSMGNNLIGFKVS